MGGIYEEALRLYDALLQRDAYGLLDQHVHYLRILQPLPAELRQQARVYQVRLLGA